MHNPTSKNGVALTALFVLFLSKRVIIEIWVKETYREFLTYASGVALIVVVGFGVSSMVRERQKKND